MRNIQTEKVREREREKESGREREKEKKYENLINQIIHF